MKNRLYRALSMIMITAMLAGQTTVLPLAEEETMTMTETVPETESMTEPAAETTTEAVTEAITEPVTEGATEATTECVTESVEKSTEEAAAESTTEFATESMTEAATESITEAATESTTEPVTESSTEAVTDSVSEIEDQTEITELYVEMESETEATQELAADGCTDGSHKDTDYPYAICDAAGCNAALQASVKIGSGDLCYYASIENAIEALKDTTATMPGTLKLLTNITYADSLQINGGNFSFDLNGKKLDMQSGTGSRVYISNGTVTFLDSNTETKGKIYGQASAVSISGGTVVFESGNYEADTWTVHASGDTVSVEIKGGTFKGRVAVQNDLASLAISNGEFYGAGQASIVNNGNMMITGGTFYNRIENFSSGTLTMKEGTIYTFENGVNVAAGIDNRGVLNLYDGTISEKVSTKPCYGVKNAAGASLNLYGDVTFDCNAEEFYLENAITVCENLNNSYRVAIGGTQEETGVFANAGNGVELNPEWFKPSLSGYRTVKTADGSLALVKCVHENMDETFLCKDCGSQICAQIGNTYYITLAEAFAAVEDAKAEGQKIVKLLADIDISEEIEEKTKADGGTFTLDLNGKTITGSLRIASGNVKIQGNGGKIEGAYEGLATDSSAVVELENVTITGKNAGISNSGTLYVKSAQITGGQYGIQNIGSLKLQGGKVQGKSAGILNMRNVGDTSITGGEILSDGIAVFNLAGVMTIGTEDGNGPVITANTGILNSRMALDGIMQDALMQIKGGTICAATDISNRTGMLDLFGGSMPTMAGSVVLSGGTFTDGIGAALDEGVDLNDLLADSYRYLSSNGRFLEVADGTVTVNETVSVSQRETVEETETESENQTEADTEKDTELDTESEKQTEADTEPESELQKETDGKEDEGMKPEKNEDSKTETPETKVSDTAEVQYAAPDTGDDSNILQWLLAMGGSCLTMLFVFLNRRKRNTVF